MRPEASSVSPPLHHGGSLCLTLSPPSHIATRVNAPISVKPEASPVSPPSPTVEASVSPSLHPPTAPRA
eukprot:4060069-Pyramimonas_sp.AAC.1